MNERLEYYTKVKGVYCFMGWYALDVSTDYQVVTITRETKEKIFFNILYKNTKEITYHKILKNI